VPPIKPEPGILVEITPVVAVTAEPPWQEAQVCPPLSAGAPAVESLGNVELAVVLVMVDTIAKEQMVSREEASIVFFMSLG
jgi:hypothetical protein